MSTSRCLVATPISHNW